MRLLNRNHRQAETDDYYEERPEPDEVIEPQPERYEPQHDDPGLTDLSRRDYVAIFKRALKRFTGDHMPNIAAALAYYAFLAIPSVLLVAVGVFSLVAGPDAISTVIGKLDGVMHLGPNVKHPKWQFLTIGASVAIFVWLLASGAFAFYVSKFGSYNKAWGSLSAVVVMLTWLWLSSVALLFGVVVNAEAERSRELRRGEPAETELRVPAKA